MADKKVQFAEGDLAAEFAASSGAAADAGSKDSRFKAKHSLDSDEEDNPDNYDLMQEDDIEGQEDATIDYDEGITITPFNMKEELEEGHFDTDGMYIYEKDKNQVRDEWIDNIDWVKIKEKEKKYGSDDDDDDEDGDDDEQPHSVDKISFYKQMLELMKEGESVNKALRRLGGGKSFASASQRWKKQKTQKADQSEEDKQKAEKNSADFLKLTGFADELLSCGELEIYQATYEKLAFTVKEAEEKEASKKTQIPEGVDDDDALDMFAADIDSKKDEKSDESSSAKAEKSDEPPTSKNKDASADSSQSQSQLMWEYKWEDKDDAEIHGPHTSQEMLDWQEADFFQAGVFCRKVGTGAPFYSSKRIDFDLYT